MMPGMRYARYLSDYALSCTVYMAKNTCVSGTLLTFLKKNSICVGKHLFNVKLCYTGREFDFTTVLV